MGFFGFILGVAATIVFALLVWAIVVEEPARKQFRVDCLADRGVTIGREGWLACIKEDAVIRVR